MKEDDLSDALDLWRDDVRRVAAGLDADRLADRVLAAAARDAVEGRALRRYAAAALVLIGLGALGAALVPVHPADLPAGAATHVLENDRLDLEAERALLVLGPLGGG